jgi:hypothetical protein
MIKNFDEIKKQLSELTDVINGYKSETVQLKIMEALLSSFGSSNSRTIETSAKEGTPPPTKPAGKKQSKTPNVGNASAAGSGRTKPKAAILKLISDGYFAKRRTAPQVQADIKDNIAVTLSVAAIQNALNRLLHDKTIQRGKNSDDQYEYWRE